MSGVARHLEGSLITKLEAWKTANPTLVSMIKYPNKAEDSPEADTTKMWLRVSFFPDETDQLTVGDDGLNTMGGIMLINVFAPKGDGAGNANDVADSLVSYLKRGTDCPTVSGYYARVMRSFKSAPIEEERWFNVPVNVRWFQHVANV